MKTITFQIHRGNSFISKQIMKRSCGKFSHVSIGLENKIIESVEGKGVVSTNPLAWNRDTVVEVYSVTMSDKRYNEVYEWLSSQEGKLYDYTGVFAHVLPIFMKPKMGKWYCSELAYVTLAKIGGILGDDIGQQKISPQVFRDSLRLPRAKRIV